MIYLEDTPEIQAATLRWSIINTVANPTQHTNPISTYYGITRGSPLRRLYSSRIVCISKNSTSTLTHTQTRQSIQISAGEAPNSNPITLARTSPPGVGATRQPWIHFMTRAFFSMIDTGRRFAPAALEVGRSLAIESESAFDLKYRFHI